MDIVEILLASLRGAFAPEAAVYALAAIGLNVHFGYTGLLNFGQVGFMLVGAYGLAISVSTFGWPMWAGVLVGLLCAAVLALLLGVPTLRLRGDYLAIVTIAAAEIMRLVYRAEFANDVTGSVYGLQQFANPFFELNPIPSGSYGFGRFSYSDRDLWVMIVGWGLVALVALMVYLLVHSPWGRVLRGIREDEDAVRALGKNVFGFKIQSLLLGGVIGGLAGVMFAIGFQSVQPDTFNPEITFFLWTVLLMGGAGRVLGPIVGAWMFWFLLVLMDTALRQALSAGYISDSIMESSDIGPLRFAVVGLLLMLIMIYRPQGVLGSRREMLLRDR